MSVTDTTAIPPIPPTPSVAATSTVMSVPPAASGIAVAHFAARLSLEADVSDVHADQALIGTAFVLVDTRSSESWAQGRVPGAVHLPTRQIAARAADGTLADLVPSGTPVVTYCWGPGCNGATKAALAFAALGYPVKEMIGGFEYWVREGYTYDSAWGRRDPAADPLAAPVDDASCGC
ncbi:MAG TPA: rhodanese-like domain-containing protein [Actinocrinis sp.]|nr:rhodanese-like domain-containing protein [Actinocrinis sp.]HEV3171987.1 rhodanese-like domain-containing protein [Actinocrinis sp.]